MRVSAGILFLVLAQGLAGCGGSASSPSAPSPVPQAVPQPIPQPVPEPTPSGVRVDGIVYDSAVRPLPGARVEVVDGLHAGMSTTADANGQFSLTGTFDSTTTFRATKEGHVAAIRTWNEFAPPGRPWLNFVLALLVPPVNMAGDYTLTFIADSACPDLPNEVRSRTYAATITLAPYPNTPADTSFKVTVSGAPLLENYRNFFVSVAGDYLAFWLDDQHGTPSLVEQVAGDTYLAFAGSASASVGTSAVSTITTSLDGSIDYCVLQSGASPLVGGRYSCIPGQAVAHGQCTSKNHQLILTRR